MAEFADAPDSGSSVRKAVEVQAPNALHIARRTKNPDDLRGLCFMPVNDWIRIDDKEALLFVGQLLARMTYARPPGEA